MDSLLEFNWNLDHYKTCYYDSHFENDNEEKNPTLISNHPDSKISLNSDLDKIEKFDNINEKYDLEIGMFAVIRPNDETFLNGNYTSHFYLFDERMKAGGVGGERAN